MTTSATFTPCPSKAIYYVVIQLQKNNCCITAYLTKPKTLSVQSLVTSFRSSNTFFSILISLYRAINLPKVCRTKACSDWNLVLQQVQFLCPATDEDNQHLSHYFVHFSGQLQHQLLLCKETRSKGRKFRLCGQIAEQTRLFF